MHVHIDSLDCHLSYQITYLSDRQYLPDKPGHVRIAGQKSASMVILDPILYIFDTTQRRRRRRGQWRSHCLLLVQLQQLRQVTTDGQSHQVIGISSDSNIDSISITRSVYNHSPPIVISSLDLLSSSTVYFNPDLDLVDAHVPRWTPTAWILSKRQVGWIHLNTSNDITRDSFSVRKPKSARLTAVSVS